MNIYAKHSCKIIRIMSVFTPTCKRRDTKNDTILETLDSRAWDS